MIKTEQNWEIGDCLDLLPLIKDKSINMILCDLPYGITQNKWDTIIPFEPLWKEWERIITDNGAIVLTAQSPFDKLLGVSNIKLFKYEWIWEKTQGTGHLNAKKMPLKKHENILIFYKNLPIYNPQMIPSKMRKVKRNNQIAKTTNYGKYIEIAESIYDGRYPTSILNFNSNHGLHPTQKPVKLFEYLIKTYTNEGDWVHDSCLGSGTTLEACRNTNRNCIGFEISDEWEKYYAKRSMNNIPQLENYFK